MVKQFLKAFNNCFNKLSQASQKPVVSQFTLFCSIAFSQRKSRGDSLMKMMLILVDFVISWGCLSLSKRQAKIQSTSVQLRVENVSFILHFSLNFHVLLLFSFHSFILSSSSVLCLIVIFEFGYWLVLLFQFNSFVYLFHNCILAYIQHISFSPFC